jgi:hypothetical protein
MCHPYPYPYPYREPIMPATPLPPDRHPQRQTPPPQRDLNQAWTALLDDLTELNARLEYLRLMLKLGVRRP